MASGGFFSAAVSESGELYTWGHGKDGQLGHGDLKALGRRAVLELLKEGWNEVDGLGGSQAPNSAV